MTSNNENIFIPAQQEAKFAFIWLHGLGADGRDLESIAKRISFRFPNSYHILPNAPYRNISLFQGERTRAWYDIPSQNFFQDQDKIGISTSASTIHHLIDKQIAKGINSTNIFLFGFSQGAALALYSGLSYKKPLGGIISCSGYLPLIENFASFFDSNNQNIKINLSAGSQDSILPEFLSKISYEFLISNNLDIFYKTYAMEHSICEDQIQDIENWLASFL